MLNISLTNPYPKLNDTLMEEPKFKEAMSSLLENTNIVIKGKSILTILLLFKMNPHWIILVDEFKFYTTCDRMSRDYSKYIQYCLLCLIDGVIELLPKIISQITHDFSAYIKNQKVFDNQKETTLSRLVNEASKKIKPNKADELPGNLILTVAVFVLLKSTVFKNKIFIKDLIVFIGVILEHSEKIETETGYQIK
jgi:hypothetical protein